MTTKELKEKLESTRGDYEALRELFRELYKDPEIFQKKEDVYLCCVSVLCDDGR